MVFRAQKVPWGECAAATARVERREGLNCVTPSKCAGGRVRVNMFHLYLSWKSAKAVEVQQHAQALCKVLHPVIFGPLLPYLPIGLCDEIETNELPYGERVQNSD